MTTLSNLHLQSGNTLSFTKSIVARPTMSESFRVMQHLSFSSLLGPSLPYLSCHTCQRCAHTVGILYGTVDHCIYNMHGESHWAHGSLHWTAFRDACRLRFQIMNAGMQCHDGNYAFGGFGDLCTKYSFDV
ncbi:hypothetical protein P280DRAFT_277855 [Massarina eburnea CBS 473.64]|uniref:Uncharacterized protein n=1 Tax=Massarina eburnea CBS 473.64 TaxID=1395130 RepID=A0A6A6RK41_9PLEO|nr:hypothetical protein P280DRAFT_277855 [Massarina eburnea CBS 473.64]